MPNLIRLDLRNNQIGDEGMKAFSTAISSGSMGALEVLNLSVNQIGDAGLRALAGAIGRVAGDCAGEVGHPCIAYLVVAEVKASERPQRPGEVTCYQYNHAISIRSASKIYTTVLVLIWLLVDQVNSTLLTCCL
jgi:hypothetical protein